MIKMSCELIIQNNSGKLMSPAVLEGIVWSTERFGAAGKLTFKVMKDESLAFHEGNAVRFKFDGNNIFYGYVFSKKRSDNDVIEVVAYDQLRYLKNKDTYVIENKSAAEVIKMIADDFKLKTGSVAGTQYKIGSLTADNQTLFDIIGNALDETLKNTGTLYVMYDDFGQIVLKDLGSMKVGMLIDDSAAQQFDYTSSIDDQTYNQVKLTYENSKTGERDVYITKDSTNQNAWGVLQFTDKIQGTENGAAKAEALLKLYNVKTRKLTIKGVKGDCSVRAGSLIPVMLNVGDLIIKNYLLVESCKHTFNNDEHTMELKLKGGGFNV